MHRDASKLMTKLSALGLAAGLLVFAAGLAAQQQGSGRVRCGFRKADVARVMGRLIDLEGGTPVRLQVRLARSALRKGCTVTSTDSGVFEFRNVPTGQWQLRLAGLQFDSIAPISVNVDGDSVIRLVIPVSRTNALSRCMSLGSCAGILTQRLPSEVVVDTDKQLYLLGYRLSIALAGEGWGQDGTWVACLDDSDEVVRTVRQMYPEVAPRTECHIPRPAPDFAHRLATHVPTGRPARLIQRPVIDDISPQTARLSLGYTEAARAGKGYTCEVHRVHDTWVPTACHVTWIS